MLGTGVLSMWRFLTRASDDRGFSIAEILAASSILVVVVAGVATGLVTASTSSASAARRETALNVANEQLEKMRNIAYDDVGVVGGDPAGTIPVEQAIGGFTVTTDVDWVRDTASGRATYKTVGITISWTKPRPGHVDIESNIFGKSELANAGDISITCLDSETNAPIQNVTVTVTPGTNPSRSKLSGADGEAFFGYVPSGTFTLAATSSDYVFDLSGTSSSELIADTLARLTIYGYRASRAVITVQDSGGSPIPGATVALTTPTGSVFTQTTGADGTATIGGLDKGDCTVDVTAAGRSRGVTSVTIPAGGGQTAYATVTLNDPATLRVRVLDTATGNPVEGARVEVHGPTSINPPPLVGTALLTSASGEVSFDSISDAGDYSATVTMSGYAPGSGAIALSPPGNADLTIQIAPVSSGSLRVFLHDKEGDPLAARRQIRITPADGSPSSTFYTDNSGQALLTDLAPGQYSLKGTGSKDKWTATAYVVAGRTETVVVTVRR